MFSGCACVPACVIVTGRIVTVVFCAVYKCCYLYLVDHLYFTVMVEAYNTIKTK